jgi:hypothetical protein
LPGIGVSAVIQWAIVKVRISKTPDIAEMDGVRLDDMRPGSVREVSPSIGSWLIAERYAEPEMRSSFRMYEEDFLNEHEAPPDPVRNIPRRRSYER